MTTDRKDRRILRVLVYVMLALSALGTFLVGDRLWAAARVGDVPLWTPLVAPGAFTAFVIVYAADRWLLVRAVRYPVARAIVQVAFAVVFMSLLWPHQASELRQAKAITHEADVAVRMLESPNEEVRALACEVLGWRVQISAEEALQRVVRDDPAAQVQARCREALGRLQGATAPPSPVSPLSPPH